jgi:hypothetical protein
MCPCRACQGRAYLARSAFYGPFSSSSTWGVSSSAPKELVCCLSVGGLSLSPNVLRIFPFLFDTHRTFRGLCHKMEEDFLLSVNPKPIYFFIIL